MRPLLLPLFFYLFVCFKHTQQQGGKKERNESIKIEHTLLPSYFPVIIMQHHSHHLRNEMVPRISSRAVITSSRADFGPLPMYFCLFCTATSNRTGIKCLALLFAFKGKALSLRECLDSCMLNRHLRFMLISGSRPCLQGGGLTPSPFHSEL